MAELTEEQLQEIYGRYGDQHNPAGYAEEIEALGYQPQYVSGKVPTYQYGSTVLGDSTKGTTRTGELEQQSYAERSGLPTSGTATKAYSYYDEARGVQVHAAPGQHFELYPGGGVRQVSGLIPKEGAKEGAPASSLFTQETQAVPGGAEGETQTTPGFQQESLAYQPAEGKTIARTGQTLFNPTTGVDVHAKPGNVIIEYTDGTFEERPYGGAPGTTAPVGQAGPTAQELGITRGTEIKGPGGEVARAPQSIDDLALINPEEADKAIVAKGLASTKDLVFLGTSRDGKIAKEGNAFYQAPDGTVLERPLALQGLAKKPDAGQKLDLAQMLSDLGFDADMGALQQSFQSNPAKSVQDMYSSLLENSGFSSIKAQVSEILKQQKDLDAKYAESIKDINENPWLSESLRTRKINAANEKYQIQKSQLAAQLTLWQGLMDDARQEAQFLTSAALQQFNADRAFALDQQQFAFQKAEARLDAQFKLQELEARKEESAQDREFRERQFEEDVRQFGLNYALQQQQEARLARTGREGTAGERAISRLGAISGEIENILTSDRNQGENGAFTTIAAYRTARNRALQQGVSPDDFDTVYGNTLSPYDRLTYGIGSTTNISQVGKVGGRSETITFDET